MPLLKLQTTVTTPKEKRDILLADLSRITSESLGKPEAYVMVTMQSVEILMAGKHGDAALVEVRNIGAMNADLTRNLSAKICARLGEALGIARDRIYLNFENVAASQWGWNGGVFG